MAMQGRKWQWNWWEKEHARAKIYRDIANANPAKIINHIIHYRILAPNYINNFISEPHFLIKQTCNLKPKLIKWFTAIYTIEQFQPFFLYLIPIFKHKHFIRNLSNCVNLSRAHLYCPCGSAFFGEYLFSTLESMQINWLAGTWIS